MPNDQRVIDEFMEFLKLSDGKASEIKITLDRTMRLVADIADRAERLAMRRHWLVTDENHAHYLVLAEDENQAKVLLQQKNGIPLAEMEELWVVKRIPDIASFDLDNEPTFHGPPLSSET